jgi:transposase
MSTALSLDLRERVLAAIAGGMSDPLGGDRRSKRIEAHAEVILALVDETRDMTLEELRAALADQGLEFGYGTLWRFFDRRGITLKKRQRMRYRGTRAGLQNPQP